MSKGDKDRTADKGQYRNNWDKIFKPKIPPHSKTFDKLHKIIDDWGEIREDLTEEEINDIINDNTVK